MTLAGWFSPFVEGVAALFLSTRIRQIRLHPASDAGSNLLLNKVCICLGNVAKPRSTMPFDSWCLIR